MKRKLSLKTEANGDLLIIRAPPTPGYQVDAKFNRCVDAGSCPLQYTHAFISVQ